MGLYSIPIIFNIEADSLDDAKQAMDEWHQSVNFNDMPDGIDSIHYDLKTEIDPDDGSRVIYLPPIEEEDSYQDEGGADFNESSLEDLDE